MVETFAALPWWAVLAGVAGGVIIGFSKTSFGGLGAVAVALFALVMPAKESTAAVLLLLILGDGIALLFYGRHVHWRLLLKLVPAVLPGLLLGALFLNWVSDAVLRRSIGALLLAMLLLQLWSRRRTKNAEPPPAPSTPVTVLAGVAAGFTTMTANAAGPVMSLYLLAQRFDKARFLSTNAWFFALVNLTKVPLTASLGLFTPAVLTTVLILIPTVLVGAALGRFVIHRVTQQRFESLTLIATAVSSAALLVR